MTDIAFVFIFYFSRLPAVAMNIFNCAFKKDWIYQVQAVNAAFVLLCAYVMLGVYDTSLRTTLLVLSASQYFFFLPIMIGVTYRGVRQYIARSMDPTF
ncbi:hypothetical protein GCM10007047_22130 [Cerasicoccus arenae]|uniref:Uncharacterized protein n=2 Tax=Cerasicoccus arenae TaxID=424488 RepID=A0A8J3GDV1_9BACT|nr:hypothetical protein GCM10007047_22130 [Cerasicoccus arenae]